MARKKTSVLKPKRPGPAAITSKNPLPPQSKLDPTIYRVPTIKRHRGPATGRAIPGTGVPRGTR